jgi:2-keto-4-pentenoate hydratase/2-oxohepta-3-ene-1,7-dioic acid hydratase in catechol pathway
VRIARVGAPGAERPVVVAADGELLDLGGLTGDVDAAFLGSLAGLDPSTLPELVRPPGAGVPRFGAPVTRPGKVVGIGLNYRDHAAEAGMPLPAEPVVFLKSPTSVSGPTDDVVMLPGSTTTDYEVELGVVLGRDLRGECDPDRALSAVAGYLLAQDVSDRALQLERGGTWTKGKSADTFCPLGPWLVTPDELGPLGVGGVRLRLTVDGDLRQDGSPSDMVFGIGELLCYTSGLMTLEAGDVVLTGTPAGVAMGRPEPRPYLRHGQVVEADGGVLGRQRTRVVDPGRAGQPRRTESVALDEEAAAG